ncbi:beta-L-arabinofuranosidase domain-containing protein [Paenibacillus sp. P32E]|uniref:beta-L-arabinofuranosidase domain-containing protein n=1 Tax=Paenibacillus sp. P32E TaxID=1349434 RepID=UPI00093CC65E|nr:beta-L-arabinofuranosidase domain-containing protein [Paenibacillus sp. P32E]OKP88219.1 hypothetical protein A3848_17985 [Paenibacillus sp. P32E]
MTLGNNPLLTTEQSPIHPFPMNQVTLTDPYMVNALSKEILYLKSYDPDRLLAGFRENRGLPPKGEKYPGWENTEIRGHTLGHYLTATAQAYENTSSSGLLERLEYIIGELGECQLENGYLSAFPETLFDHVENKQPAWVPWYTMHKIIAGLVAVYRSTHNTAAYRIVSGLGEWVYRRVSAWSPEIQERVLSVEYGGMNDCLYDLYKITQDGHHLYAAHMFDELALFTPVREGRDILKGKHANTTIPKFLGALNRYLVLGEGERFYLEAAVQFWDMVVNHHSYITGGNSEWEHFGDPDILDGERSNFTAETCNTYNMLKLTKELFKLTGDIKYADFYENTFINAILSSQHPHTGMTMYFQPMATGYFKVYSSPFDHFWCCTGTGMESFTKLNDSLYFHRSNSLYVNQYVSSTLVSEAHRIELEQEANLPYKDTVTFNLRTLDSQATTLELRIRIPDWIAGTMNIHLNGNTVAFRTEGRYAVLENVWKDGDKLSIQFPMKPFYCTLPDAPNVVAFKYGPVVLSAALGKDDLTQSATGVAVSVPTKNMLVKDFITPSHGSISDWLDHFEEHFIRKNGDLVFVLRGTDEDGRLEFTPHYKQHEERYGIYWKLVETDSRELQEHIWHGKQDQTIREATIDSLPVGNDQYELEHGIQGENTTVAVWDGYTLRQAENNGWFSYRLKVLPEQDNYLSVTYFSGNNGKAIDIYVDGKLLASDTLITDKVRTFYNKRYLIPAERIKTATEVEIKFVIPGQMNGIFDQLRMMTSYSSNAELAELIFDAGSLSGAFTADQSDYTLTVSAGIPAVRMHANPSHKNALVYVNDILIEDTLPRTVFLSSPITNVQISVTAEDLEVVKKYKITIIKPA